MARKKDSAAITEQAIFPTKLRMLMQKHRTTREQLANYLGVTRQSVGYYAQGQSSPDLTAIVKIAKYFNVSTDYLLTETEIESPDANIQTICKNTGLSERSINNILKIGCLKKERNCEVTPLCALDLILQSECDKLETLCKYASMLMGKGVKEFDGQLREDGLFYAELSDIEERLKDKYGVDFYVVAGSEVRDQYKDLAVMEFREILEDAYCLNEARKDKPDAERFLGELSHFSVKDRERIFNAVICKNIAESPQEEADDDDQ